jgi:SAM-dependent methyltransferase
VLRSSLSLLLDGLNWSTPRGAHCYGRLRRITGGSSYSFDSGWPHERERLAALERAFDPGTIRAFEAVGVANGWRCLEVGAGGGSIIGWLSRRVGLTGQVVATDVDTRFLDRLHHANLEVRRHDIVKDPTLEGRFELVHARLLLEHLPARQEVLNRLVELLVPGGWLVLEDMDFATWVSSQPEPTHARVVEAVEVLVTSTGWDVEFGRRLPSLMARVGLAEVTATGASSMDRDVVRLTRGLLLQQLRPRLVEASLATDSEIDHVLALLDDPEFFAMTPTLVTARGRLPPRTLAT